MTIFLQVCLLLFQEPFCFDELGRKYFCIFVFITSFFCVTCGSLSGRPVQKKEVKCWELYFSVTVVSCQSNKECCSFSVIFHLNCYQVFSPVTSFQLRFAWKWGNCYDVWGRLAFLVMKMMMCLLCASNILWSPLWSTQIRSLRLQTFDGLKSNPLLHQH